MSTEIVAARMGAGEFALPLESACVRYRIQTVNDKCHFLANTYVESAGFKKTIEGLDYSTDRLRHVFKRISAADAQKYGRNAQHSANQRELARVLYNGFLGRGLIQLTWEDNYRDYSMAQYGDDRIVRNPEMLQRLPDAALSAGWFYAEHVPLSARNGTDCRAVRSHINPALVGIDEVEAQFVRAQKLFRELLA